MPVTLYAYDVVSLHSEQDAFAGRLKASALPLLKSVAVISKVSNV